MPTNNQPNHVDKIILLFIAAYPMQEYPKETQELHKQLFADLDPEILMVAIEDLITKETWRPDVAKVRARCAELALMAKDVLPAELAWAKVTQQITAVGGYGIPDLDEITKEAVKSIGGWQQLCYSEKPGVQRAHFYRAYEQLHKREKEGLQSLPGVAQLVHKLAARNAGAPVLPEKTGG